MANYAAAGRPTKLTPETQAAICEDVRQGCYVTVAGNRHGVSQYAMYLWSQRGKRECEEREEARARGEPVDEPASIYEQFHIALEAAKAEARFSAETRVFRSMPLHWLRSGYARNDWRESDQFVRAVEDAVEAKLRQLAEAQPETAPAWQRTLTDEELAQVSAHMLAIHLFNRVPGQPLPPDLERTLRDIAAHLPEPITDVVPAATNGHKEQSYGHQPATLVPQV